MSVIAINQRVSYVKDTDGLYLKSQMRHYKELEPYISNKRGVYILVNQTKQQLYVGEGDILNRLTRHKRHKEWAEEVYIYLKEPTMTKEESLEYEGAFVHYFNQNTEFTLTNKDKVRDNKEGMSKHMQKFQWLGLTYPRVSHYTIRNHQGVHMFDCLRTYKSTYQINNVYIEKLNWLTGYEFESLEDVYTLTQLHYKGDEE